MNGNLTQQRTKIYEWDAANRLARVVENGTEIARFTYNGFGRRVTKTIGANTTTYLYDGDQILQERALAGTTRHIDGFGIDQHLASVASSGEVTYYLTDHLGSVVQETNASSTVTLTRQYEPWGELIQGQSTSGYAYTGREWDAETGLYYYRARYHSPYLGRFLSADLMGFAAGINSYSYVLNSPTGLTDPMGLCSQSTDQLLKFSDLVKNYPSHESFPTDPNAPNSIWALIGGHVAMNAWGKDQNGNPVPNNTCALRISYDLNQSGVTIPKGQGTVSGANGEQYFLRVADLQKFLTNVLGPPERLSGGSFTGPSGSSGIISFNVPFRNATGHFTLWTGQGVGDPREPYEQWPKPTGVLFWRVK